MALLACSQPHSAQVDFEHRQPLPERKPKNGWKKMRTQELEDTLAEHEVDWERVRYLTAVEDLDPNVTDWKTGTSTIHRCAYDGEVEILRLCIQERADINAKSAIGRSALHYACDANRIGCVRLLLELQADINLRTLSHQTPLHLCCAYESYESLLELLHGQRDVIDVDAVDMRGQLPEALKRLFGLFDRDGNSYIMPEECAESQVLLAQHLAHDTAAGNEKFVEAAHLDMEGVVSWEEFRDSHLSLIGALPVEHQKLMERLCELEAIILNEVTQDDMTDSKEPLSPLVRKLAMQRRMTLFDKVSGQ